jgi:hypothetical protein
MMLFLWNVECYKERKKESEFLNLNYLYQNIDTIFVVHNISQN